MIFEQNLEFSEKILDITDIFQKKLDTTIYGHYMNTKIHNYIQPVYNFGQSLRWPLYTGCSVSKLTFTKVSLAPDTSVIL